MDVVPRSILVFALILLGGFFTSVETAFASVNVIRITQQAEDGNRSAKRLVKMLDKFDDTLIGLIIGTNICYTAASTIATVLFVDLLKNEAWGSIIATIVTTVIVFIFAELFPKNIAHLYADKYSVLVAYPITILNLILFPISFIFMKMSDLFKKLVPKKIEEPTYTEDEFQDIVETVEEEGELNAEERDMINSAVEYDDKTVKMVMMPLDKVFSVNLGMTEDEIKEKLLSVKYSRVPVYVSGSSKKFKGVLRSVDYLVASLNDEKVNMQAYIMPPVYVKESTKISNVFDIMKKKKTHMAFVVTSDMTVKGIVTLEDILEEIVGDIYDEDELTPSKGGARV